MHGSLKRKHLQQFKEPNIPCLCDEIHIWSLHGHSSDLTLSSFPPHSIWTHSPLKALPHLFPTVLCSLPFYFYIFLPFPFTSCPPSLYFPSFPVGPWVSAQDWFELGLHLHVDTCTALWNIVYVQSYALHRELMTPDAYRSSQIRKFLTSIIKHITWGIKSWRDPYNLTYWNFYHADIFCVMSANFFLANSIFWNYSILLHHWITHFDSCIMSLRGAVVFDLGMHRCSHTHSLAVMCLCHIIPLLHPYCGPLFVQEVSEAETRVY